MRLESAFRRYVTTRDELVVVDGWKRLMDGADRSINWNPESLE